MVIVLLELQLIVIIALLVGLYQKITNGLCKSKKRLDGKTVVVTGGTSGMGLEIALDLAHRGARVIVACPFADEGTNARELIIKQSGNENIVFKLLDLASLDSVRNFAADILKSEDRLDILVNNAGVGIPRDFVTKDGMNFIMQVNYFGHFLLTILLLPLLVKSGTEKEPSRILNTTSILHYIARFDLNNINKVGHYYKVQVYGNSKFCLILFSRELTRRLRNKNVVINNVNPGAVGTRIFGRSGLLLGNVVTFLFYFLFKTPWEGVQTALYTALSEKSGKVSGELFENCKLARGRRDAYSEKDALRLWEESIRLVKLNEDELKKCLNA